MKSIRDLFGKVLDWIYPPLCADCGKPGKLICDDCLSKLRYVGEHYCSVCGKPLKKGKHCRLCGSSEFHFRASRAPYIYEGPASAMIKKLKYGGCLGLAPIMAKHLAAYWQGLDWKIDMVIPVPLSRERRAQRGFNQSEMIARSFVKMTGLSLDPRALIKIRNTENQVGLNAEQRRENLSGAFAAEPVLVRGKQVLLLDDVMTTGSTFAECTDALLDSGADTVYCLSVATTSDEHGMQQMLHAQ